MADKIPGCACCGRPRQPDERLCEVCDDLRDVFAERSFPILMLLRSKINPGSKAYPSMEQTTDNAYVWADSMLKSKRKEPV
jgi:hypothetical protein